MKKSLPLVGLFLLVAAWCAAPASANELILRDCDAVQFDPPRVLVKFDAVNLGPFLVCAIRVRPIPEFNYPPCAIFQCTSADSTWECEINPVGEAILRNAGATDCLAPYEVIEGFEFVLEPGLCHFWVEYLAADGQVVHFNDALFPCDPPVPARPPTWGRVKARYH